VSAQPAWPEFSYAFQPIVDADLGAAVSYEALIRGPDGASAASVFAKVPRGEVHRFDAHSREAAVGLAARLGVPGQLNLNCLPRSLMSDDGPVRRTLGAAARHGIAYDRIVLEVTEDEVIDDQVQFASVINRFRAMGMKVAIDDFGAGYAGLTLLADFQPDLVKLDMKLVRGIERHGPRQAIVRAILQACNDLGIELLAEGVETVAEFEWFRAQGVALFQGYLLARPAFEALPGFVLPGGFVTAAAG
jgi:EAL domain-containing protein (putative c-di-GMP-specific phosphodiesterase class I)